MQTNAVGLFVDLQGLSLTPQERTLLCQPRVCGVILFARNYRNPEQLRTLTRTIKQQRTDLLIAADQEGGRVQRFKQGFTRLPPMMRLFDLYQNDPKRACQCAHSIGWLMAYELLECGVDLSFAPVLDVESGCSEVIGDRSFATEPKAVCALSSAFCEGMHALNMPAVGKHFPGHGGVRADTHIQAAVDIRSLAQLEQRDLMPFYTLIKRQQLQGIMPAHVRYPQVDAEHNAGFSQIWLQHILRQKMQFNGVIFSDDLSMQGAANAGKPVARAKAAIQAGCNALLLCNQAQDSYAVLDYLQCLDENQYPVLNLAHWQTRFMPNPKQHTQAQNTLSTWS